MLKFIETRIGNAAIVILCLFSFSVTGQEEVPPVETQSPAATSPAVPSIPDQLLEDEFALLQEPVIESASKREESLFTSPLSSDVITHDRILKSGARNIPEALRLLPGMIVREISSGNFDVHIRGLDNIPPGGWTHDFPLPPCWS